MFNGGVFGSTVSPADMATALGLKADASTVSALPATVAPLPAASVAALGTSARLAKEDHRHRGVYILHQFNTPLILISSGTVDSSGGFSGLTALQTQPPAGYQTYVYVAAGIGLAAGWYLATWSSTSTCQLVGNPATTAGAYAGVTPGTWVTATPATTTLPANSLGLKGSVRCRYRVANNNNANSKYYQFLAASSIIHGNTSTTATTKGDECAIRNMNSLTVQECYSYNGEYGANAPQVYLALDTATDLTLSHRLQSATSAADTISLYFVEIDVRPSIT